MDDFPEYRLDKTALSVVSLEAADDEQMYWWTRTPEERLRHMEYLRRLNYGYQATERLQGFLEVAERT